MVQRQGGYRKKTRHKLQKRARDRGKLPVTRIMQEFKIGDRVTIKQEPSVHKAMPHPRYKNKMGKIIERRGESYVVEIMDSNKRKELISAPVHLARA